MASRETVTPGAGLPRRRFSGPPVLLQPDPCIYDDDAFSNEERPFHRFVAAIATEPAAGGYYAVRRDIGAPDTLHDVADGPGCPRPSSHRGDIAVGCDATGRNAPNDREHARREVASAQFRADRRAVPCA